MAFTSFKSFEFLKKHKIDTVLLLEYHFTEIFKMVKKRLSIKQTLRNPWKAVIRYNLHNRLFTEWFRAVRDHSTAYGREISVKRDHKKNVNKSIDIKFTHLGTLKFMTARALWEIDVEKFFEKKVGNCMAKVVVSEDKPFTLQFQCNKNVLIVSCSYEVTNRYGTVISL